VHNQILATLSQSDLARLQPRLREVTFSPNEIISEPGQQASQVFFPHAGTVISLVVELESGHRLEAALIGRDGVLGGAAALDSAPSVSTAVAQMPGRATAIRVDDLKRVAEQSPSVRSMLARNEQFLLAQSQQSAACNARHSIEERLCRWLLRMSDAAGTPDLNATHDLLAQMLGVQRASITIAASGLQQKGLIKYSRGRIHIADEAGLLACSCECYEAVKQHYEDLFIDIKAQSHPTGAVHSPHDHS
jgi:CRP-like cAMP-binding protein